MTSSLDHMPAVVLNLVLENCEFREIVTLRKVCRTLRNFIDSSAPDLKLPCIILKVYDSKITINYGNDLNIQYLTSENGVHVGLQEDNKSTVLENAHFLDVVLEDLKFALTFQKSKMDQFTLRWDFKEDFDAGNFVKRLENILELKSLSTRAFHMEAHNQTEILSLLSKLDSQSLEELWIFNPDKQNPECFFDLNRVVELDQWKCLKSIGIPTFSISESLLPKFSHIVWSVLNFEEISLEAVVALKNALLQSSTFQICDFYYKNLKATDEEIEERFGVPQVETRGKKWFLNIEGSEQMIGIVQEKGVYSRVKKFSNFYTLLQLVPADREPNVRRPSADCPPTVRRLSADRPPTVRRPSADCPPTVRRLSADRPLTVRRPSADRPATVRRPSLDRPPTIRRSSADRPSTVRRPSIDRSATVHRPSADRPSTVRQPSTDRPPTIRRPFADRPSTVRRPSGDRPSTVRQPSGDRPPTVHRPSADDPPTVRRPSIDRSATVHRPSADRPSTVRQPSTDRPPTIRRPFADRPSTVRRPSIDRPRTVHPPSVDGPPTPPPTVRRPLRRPSIDRPPNVHRPSADRSPTVHRPSADRSPTDRRPSALKILSIFASVLSFPNLNDAGCTRRTNSTILAAYSNDLDEYDVNMLRSSIFFDNSIFYGYTMFANVRFDVRVEEEIQYHSDRFSFNASMSARMPDPSLGYNDTTTGSDVFNVLQKFLHNKQAPICGALVYIVAKRYPNDKALRDLITELRDKHIFVYIVAHDFRSGGSNPGALYEVADKTNGFCIFNSGGNFWVSVSDLGSVNYRKYQFQSQTFNVSGIGRLELPVWQTPNPNPYSEQMLVVIIVQNHSLSNFISLNYTIETTDKSFVWVGPDQSSGWPRFGTGILAQPQLNGTTDYKWTIDYHYSNNEPQQIETRLYSNYYHDFLPLPPM
ncbi:unnamed protein product [Caenorhabditis nigoni]